MSEYRITLAGGRVLEVSADSKPERDPSTGSLLVRAGGCVVARIDGWRLMGPSASRIAAGRGDIDHPSGLTIRKARIERARPFKWAWDQRILMAYLNLLIGEEGIGKGNLVAWIGAQITRGALSGDLNEPRRVAFIGDEDAWDHIWVPRLKVAGADLRRVAHVVSGGNGTFDVKADAEALREYIKTEQVALVYFDQLLDNLGVTDTWKDKQVRDVLAPLVQVARETECALLCSMHPNKRQGASFRDRISGTPAFNALSRSSLLAAPHPEEPGRVVVVRAKGNYSLEPHPEEPGRVVVVRAKGNYSLEPQAFEFRIEEQTVSNKRHSITTSRIADTRETPLRRDDLLNAPDRRREDSQAGQARALLAELFADGKPRPAKQVLELMDAEGFTKREAQRARQSLGIATWKDRAYQGVWLWGWKAPAKRRVKRPGPKNRAKTPFNGSSAFGTD